jgi:hypothetical protein
MRLAQAALVGAVLLAMAASPASAGGNETCSSVTSGPDVEEIRRLELRGAAINVEGWSQEEAEAFFAPEWLSVQPDGSDIKLNGVFSRFRDGRTPGWAESFLLPELDIRVYCGAAIVIGRGEIRPRGASDPSQTIRVRYLNVWRKENGRWVYAAQQYTRY